MIRCPYPSHRHKKHCRALYGNRKIHNHDMALLRRRYEDDVCDGGRVWGKGGVEAIELKSALSRNMYEVCHQKIHN